MSSEASLYSKHRAYIVEFTEARELRIPSGYGVSDKDRQVALFAWADSHPEFKAPTEDSRDVQRERQRVGVYLNREFSISPSYREYITSLAELPNVAPMSDKCRVSVNIPSYREGRRIYETLETYTKQVDDNGQPLDPETWEINIFSDTTIDVDFDNSKEEVERFIRENGDGGNLPPINFIQVKVSPPFNNIGHGRKVNTDLALFRSLRRTGQEAPLYIESEDMDQDRVDPLTIHNAITTLDNHPELDFIKGIEDRNPDVMKHNDYLFFRNRVWDFIMVLLRSKKYRDFTDPNFSFGWNRMVSGGWCTAYSAEAYAISGGHDPFAKTGEDTGLAENLSVFRSEDGNPKLDVGAHVRTRSDSTPRRFLYEMITGKNAYAQGNFDDPKTNHDIRDMSIEQLLEESKSLSRLNAENQHMFNKVLTKQVVRARDKVPAREFGNFVKTLFWILGFKPEDYTLTLNEEVPFQINSWQNIANALENYRARHPRDRRLGERIKHKNI
jgi:hypothetical protein